MATLGEGPCFRFLCLYLPDGGQAQVLRLVRELLEADDIPTFVGGDLNLQLPALFDVGSFYGIFGVGLSGNEELLTALAGWVASRKGLWVIQGDWNLSPEGLRKCSRNQLNH